MSMAGVLGGYEGSQGVSQGWGGYAVSTTVLQRKKRESGGGGLQGVGYAVSTAVLQRKKAGML